MDKFSYIANAHGEYIDGLYQSYNQNPASVDESWQKFFEGFDFANKFPENGTNNNVKSASATSNSISAGVSSDDILKEAKVAQLIYAYRSRAHLRANTNPIRERKARQSWLDLKDFGLSETDLETVFQSGNDIGIGAATLSKIISSLKHIYENTIGFEYMYIRDPEVLEWLKNKIEKDALSFNPDTNFKKHILSKLNEAVVFENFLHTKYVGQKRFSLEGGDNTITALDAIINKVADLGTKEVVIGMAHRGRLNILTNIMKKTYEQVFSEFEGTATPDLELGSGDVKYHMGYSSVITTPAGKTVNMRLAPNPSHLETVSSIVEGYVRAQIDEEHFDSHLILPILLHGDAAVAGQGIVYEVTQMAKLEGFKTGGTIHFVINNQVGFTTDFEDARSSIYCTDIAKIIDAPILHVNGDDAEAVVFCAQLAAEYRQKFQQDIFIDMVCYRKYGHNESDEPRFTQPTLYNVINKHPTPREVYSKKLIENGFDAELVKEMDVQLKAMLQERLNEVKQKALPYKFSQLEADWLKLRRSKITDFEKSPETGISIDVINKVGEAIAKIPEGFNTLKQVTKLLADRKDNFFGKKQLDWACGELLAYGSILLENKIVRLTGQDVKRGTFSHRQAVYSDSETNAKYSSLDHITPDQKQPFRIFNSHLSEYGVMGFEFGYSMANPNALVVWEAQFGDFANTAQVIIDQFIAATETKWHQMIGLVLLLPHGYEGQGPEHSSARLERFLQMCAEDNMVVVNITKAANLFHAMRRQLAWEFRKPLVVMSPKSNLRDTDFVSSPLEDFTKGSFQEVLDDDFVDTKKVRKVLLCSGKVAIDMLRKQRTENIKDVAIIRLEQLYPFPQKQLDEILKKYKKVKPVWVQEEPKNMGAFGFMLQHYGAIECISRKPSASPATGYNKIHIKEQEEILKKAFE